MVKTKLSKEEFKSGNELTDNERIGLVDKYSKLKATIEILEKDMEEVKSKLIEYALFKEVEELEGTHRKLSLKKQETFSLPPKGQDKMLVQYLKKYDYWNIFSELDKSKLINAIKEKKFSPGVIIELEKFMEPKIVYRLVFDKLDKKEENITFFTIERTQNKLEKHKLKYDEKRKLYKTRHSVFNNSFMLLFKSDKENNYDNNLKENLKNFLLNHDDVLEAKYFFDKNILGIVISMPSNIDQINIINCFEDFLFKYDYKDGKMHSIKDFDETSIKELTKYMLSLK